MILVPRGSGILAHWTSPRAQTPVQQNFTEQIAEDCGFNVIELIELNRIGTLAWFLNGRVMRRRAFGLFQIWALNVLRHCFVWPTPLYHCLL